MRTVPGKPGRLDVRSISMQLLYRGVAKMPLIPTSSRYNITLSHSKKFIWYRVAKVGTRTILNHLKDSGVPLDVEHASWLHYPVKSFGDYFKFAFVRNPWDRVVSCWRNKVVNIGNKNFFLLPDSEAEKLQTFEGFVDFLSRIDIENCDRHIRSQSALIDLNSVDYIGRMESFYDDASYVFKKLGLPEKEMVRRNVTSTETSYHKYYSDDLADKVATIYRKDIQVFGYEF
ncbi:sulfotransferase family 2 domain-containing protein [Microbulbifer bruguierae]|uniref:Sulfotransferase family 2 domain-containing protein n=1 Tax=Microbulbifer bruguierae TaxID=3029061 RepID=A0ABY8NC74_9GAMM|nr:sulfotransferase family 2 domain-containing protein [Microbulbifer bruguierae]WGL16526.1 sulfotransferase family 2 domain-containing protein [Microbulbifer bruguierae]